MKISMNWLSRYLDSGLTPEQTAELLTNTGLETENIEKTESIPGGLRNVVVGEVKEVTPHPDADRLRLTKVDAGTGELLQIVCGASNVAAGQKVAVALPGAVLHPIEGDIISIKKGKIRGQESAGMLCAEDELGLGHGHEGIMVLNPYATVGTPAADYFKLQDDHVLEIGLTPNRTDAMSHFGVARDLAAAVNRHRPGAQRLRAALPAVHPCSVDREHMSISTEIADAEKCLRYAGVCVDGLRVGPSPDWLANALKGIGLKPINNVVDVTNFVMHECGQPLHAFDADKLVGNKIVVRTFAEGTPFVSLDGVERKLNANDLMIADAKKPLCIAGVFGGIESGVSEGTTRVFIESALFHPASVRKTARRHGLNTDASFRFERGADPEMVMYAARRAAALLTEVAGGRIASNESDIYPARLQPLQVAFSAKNCRQLTGAAITDADMKAILTDLDIVITDEADGKWQLAVPRYRVDVTREADVTEEILRIYGYNSVELPVSLKASLAFTDRVNNEKYVNRVSDMLVANGYLEIMGNSLTKSDYVLLLNDADMTPETLVPVLNPLSTDLNLMRPTLLFSGLESVALNINHRQLDLRLFEFGRTYRKDENGYRETAMLSMFVTGSRMPESWRSKTEKAGFHELKGILNSVFASLGISPETAQNDGPAYFSQSIQWQFGQKTVACAGEVAGHILRKVGIDQPVFYAEVMWDLAVKQAEKTKVKFAELPRFPAVRRDLSLLVDTAVQFGDVRNTVLRTNPKLIKDVNLFDVYEGKNLETGKKSYAISLSLLDERATMTDGQIRQIMDKVTSNLEREHGAKLRM